MPNAFAGLVFNSHNVFTLCFAIVLGSNAELIALAEPIPKNLVLGIFLLQFPYSASIHVDVMILEKIELCKCS